MRNWIYVCGLLLAGSLLDVVHASGTYTYDVATDITISLTLTTQGGLKVTTNGNRVAETTTASAYKITNRTIIDAVGRERGLTFSKAAKLAFNQDGSIVVRDAQVSTNDVATGMWMAWMQPLESIPFAGVYAVDNRVGVKRVSDAGTYTTPSCLLRGEDVLLVGQEKGSYKFHQPKDGIFDKEGGGYLYYADGAGYWLYKGKITIAGPSEGMPNAGWVEGMWPIAGTISYKDRAVKTKVGL